MKTAEEIIKDMVSEMPYLLNDNIKPYIKESMQIYALQEVKKHLEIASKEAVADIFYEVAKESITDIEIKLT